MTKIEYVDLSEVVELLKSGIKPFDDLKKYIATGSLETNKIIAYENITYETKPSRANMEFEKNDIIFAKMKDTEKVYLIDEQSSDYIFSTGFAGLRVKNIKQILPKFIFYWLRSTSFQKEKNSLCSGSTQKAINNKKIKKIKIPLIDIKTQQIIINKLERIEKLVLYREENIELLDKYVKSLFNEMFLTCDYNKDLLKNNTSLITSGSTPKGGRKNYLTEGNILFIRSQNVLMNKFSNHDSLYIPEEIHNNMKRTWLKNKDVLLNITGASIGRTTIYEGKDNEANVNQHVAIIRVKNFKILNPTFLNYYLSSDIIQNHIKQVNAGATREALNFKQIGKFEIILPPIELQENFEQKITHINKLRNKMNTSKNELNKLFQSTTDKYLNGDIDVR